ncbi:MAG TPA: DUF5715 family protein [Candidatus Dormibacteraeota bacterium]|nr:DUF5715 family protein [Candidatus Dormibacteraeota bacterium]
MRTLTLSLVALLLAAPAWARGRANRWVLVANASSQAIQNARANEYDLSRMRNDAMIQQFYQDGYLVPVPSNTPSYYLYEIRAPHRYLRPWTKLFLDRLSGEYYARFRQRLRVTSLVRTVSSQIRLGYRNPNAAEATGPNRSSHLTGAALDISKRFMSPRGIEWMRSVLFRLKQAGYVYAIEEFHEPDFHVMVYPTYRELVARLMGRASGIEQSDARLSPEPATSNR